MSIEHQPIPVTILTGFLGAGKTTLLNHLIKQNPETKIAILENEFGEIGIDSELVTSSGDDIFELSNGCICCSMNAEFGEVLQRLMQMDKKFDHLVIETTGIADPAAVAAAFIGDNLIQSNFRLDSVICLVDAQNVDAMLKDREEGSKQIAFSDMIVINKADIVAKDQLQAIICTVKKINPFAECVQAEFGKQTEFDLLNLGSYKVREVENKMRFVAMNYENVHNDIVSHSFTFEQPFDLLKFRHWLNVLLMIQGESFYRVKGVLNFEGMDERCIVQSVRNNAAITLGTDWQEGMVRTSKIVFIGKKLRREIIEKGLKNCLSTISFL